MSLLSELRFVLKPKQKRYWLAARVYMAAYRTMDPEDRKFRQEMNKNLREWHRVHQHFTRDERPPCHVLPCPRYIAFAVAAELD